MRLLRNERLINFFLYLFMGIIIAMPIILIVGLCLKSESVLHSNSLSDLLFSTEWKPFQGKFGFYSYIYSSVLVTMLALLIAVPICLLTAIYLTQYAKSIYMRVIQPVIDILAGIPSIIFGVWGILVIVPLISKYIAPFFGIETAGYSILAGAIVLAVMIIPFILNILLEIFNSIAKELPQASIALGATKWQTIKYVILRKAFPGIISAIVFGLSRAFGETIAVLMVVGNVAQIPSNIFQPGYPLPALIANNYGEMLSIPNYDSALMFAALILLVIVLFFNLAARILISRYESKL
ncbi:MAG: phosphate ABC transporter permease subunit PstC [Bacteroidota bacterium]